MMSHAKLAEAQGAYRFFALLHDPQALRRDLQAISDAGGKTCRSGPVPHGQAGLASQFANLRLRETCFEKRGQNFVLASRPVPRPPVTLVVDIYSVSNRSIPPAPSQMVQFVK